MDRYSRVNKEEGTMKGDFVKTPYVRKENQEKDDLKKKD